MPPQQFGQSANAAPVVDEELAKIIKRNRRRIAKQVAQQDAARYAQQLGVSPENAAFNRPNSGRTPTSGGRSPGMIQVQQRDDDYIDYSEIADEQLEKMLKRAKPGSREYEMIAAELDARDLEDELAEIEELGEEISEFVFHHVRVFDEQSQDWVLAFQSKSFESINDLLDKIKLDYPYATRMKWGTVKKDGRKLEKISGRQYPIRTPAQASLALARDQREFIPSDNGSSHVPHMMPVQQSSNDHLIEALARINENALSRQLELMKTLKTEAKDPMEYMAQFQAMFMTPMIELIKAQNQPKGSNLNGIELAQFLVGSAEKLAKKNSGDGGSGLVGIINEIIPAIQGALAAAQQQQQQNPAMMQNRGVQQQQPQQLQNQQQQSGGLNLPNNSQPQGNSQMNILPHVRNQCRQVIQALVAGQVQVDQVPRVIFTSEPHECADYYVQMQYDEFANLLRSSVEQSEIVRSYMNRPETQKAVQWIYEEMRRLVRVIYNLHKAGREAEIEQLISWESGPLIAESVVGDEAESQFVTKYELTPEESRFPWESEAAPQPQPQGNLNIPPSRQPQQSAHANNVPVQEKPHKPKRVKVAPQKKKVKEAPPELG